MIGGCDMGQGKSHRRASDDCIYSIAEDMGAVQSCLENLVSDSKETKKLLKEHIDSVIDWKISVEKRLDGACPEKDEILKLEQHISEIRGGMRFWGFVLFSITVASSIAATVGVILSYGNKVEG